MWLTGWSEAFWSLLLANIFYWDTWGICGNYFLLLIHLKSHCWRSLQSFNYSLFSRKMSVSFSKYSSALHFLLWHCAFCTTCIITPWRTVCMPECRNVFQWFQKYNKIPSFWLLYFFLAWMTWKTIPLETFLCPLFSASPLKGLKHTDWSFNPM